MLVLGESSDPDVQDAVRIRPTSELSKCYVREPTTTAGAAPQPCCTAPSTRRGRAVRPACGSARTSRTRRAIRFYEKHGFVKVGSKRFKLGDEYEHDHVLEIAL